MGIDSSRGFVAIPRGLTDWEWYSEPNTARLFIHLLLTANWSQKQWQGITIHPGELVTSQSQLAKKLNLSIMQVRTALKHLESTGYITVKTGSKYSLITLNNYDLIEAGNRQITGKQQADNNNLTINNIKNINKSSSACATPEPTPTRTTSPIAEDFEQRICKLSIQGKAQLAGYADRLGEELVSEIVSGAPTLGLTVGRMSAKRWQRLRLRDASLWRSTAGFTPSAADGISGLTVPSRAGMIS